MGISVVRPKNNLDVERHSFPRRPNRILHPGHNHACFGTLQLRPVWRQSDIVGISHFWIDQRCSCLGLAL